MVLKRATALALALLLAAASGAAGAAARPAKPDPAPPHIEGDAAPDEPAIVAPRVPVNPRTDHDEALDPDEEISDAEPDDPGERYQTDGSDQDDFAGDERRLAEAARRPYQIDAVSGVALRIDPPQLPDLTRYTAATARAKIKRGAPGRIEVGSMLTEQSFKGFMGADERMREWAARQTSLPKVIFIRSGYVTPRDIARVVPKQYFAQTAKGVYVARLPVDVGPDATLHIDDGSDFRLSLDRGAFLVNEGKLFITGARLRGWNERRNEPAHFVDKSAFRPFMISWGGSQTYIVQSTVAHLGYAASKSYGVSISQFSPALAPIMKRPNPTGWLIDSQFYDNWYGFYCYEAEDVVIRGNDYHDNIVYGIDPHDRSRRLIIAENKAYNTKKKHGIIVSREVDDSWIINNEAYDNHLSGIVVDRNSVNNVVAHNRAYRNASDGITIYESPRTLIWQNLVSGNKRHGVRVRNSTNMRLYGNIAVGNGLSGIYGHIKDLTGTGRNLRLDPFHERISMTVVGGQLVSNGSAPVGIDQPLSLELYDVDMRAPQRQLGLKFTGILGKHQEEVLDILMRQKKAVILRPAGQVVSSNEYGPSGH
ncbi:mannuronan 5-epimerase AlgG [Solimonas soli]|uniref:mannuronan 5-epimerase AlgG n=1 Tax=Solimonas soli TaxID=413479 RepID=UPI0004B90858|nr:mannuronan 5-epimerase AlgG [Solimonas soli]